MQKREKELIAKFKTPLAERIQKEKNWDRIIARIWDFDLTCSEEHQQVIIAREHWEYLQKKHKKICNLEKADDYRKVFDWREDALEEERGVSFMNAMLDDFPNLTIEELISYGRKIKLAPGIVEYISSSRQEWNEKGIRVIDAIVSVGVKSSILGTELAEIVDLIESSEFGTNEKGEINRIKKVLKPSEKYKHVIEIAKGNPSLINQLIETENYLVPYRDIICIGDGFSDTPKFAQIKKAGGRAIAVYTENDTTAYENARKKLEKWVHAIVPRNYTAEGPARKEIERSIDRIITRTCTFDTEDIYKLLNNRPMHATKQETVKTHYKKCEECKEAMRCNIISP